MAGWAYFDCANSAYSLVIAIAIFPVYFAKLFADGEMVRFFGMQIAPSALLAYAVTIAYSIVTILSPLLSGIADYGGKRKLFQQLFTLLGAVACISMFWLTAAANWHIGFWAYVVATVGYAGGVVFNNSYMPVIATPDMYDRLSAKGFMYGYIGSVFLLLLNLIMILKFDWFGFESAAMPSRISFVMVGVWWLGFSQMARVRLPADSQVPLQRKAIALGWAEYLAVFRQVRKNSNLKNYLTAYFCYDAGVQTVLFMATVFANEVLHFGAAELIILVLILQLVGALGAWVFSKIAETRGSLIVITWMLVAWAVICLLAYLVQSKAGFYALGVGVGAVMGGIQSLSRSTYSKLVPNDNSSTSYFSFFDITDKIAVVLGTFAFGFINQITGDIRYSALTMVVFFVLGLFFIRPVRLAAD